jgi:hypothetical protein
MYRIRIRVPPKGVTHWTAQYYPQYWSERYKEWNTLTSGFDQDIVFDTEDKARYYLDNYIANHIQQVKDTIAKLDARISELSKAKESVIAIEVI